MPFYSQRRVMWIKIIRQRLLPHPIGASLFIQAGAIDIDASNIDKTTNNMANFKVPRRVEILDALPRNATGKVVKFELRERANG